MSWGNSCPGTLYFKKNIGVWKSRNFDCEFNPKTLKAEYGSFVFLMKIKGRLLLQRAPDSSFANSVRDLLKGKHKVTWIDSHWWHKPGDPYSYADNSCSFDRWKTEGLKSRFEELYWLQAELNKKGIRKATKESYAERIPVLQADIRKLSKLGAGFPVKERKKIQKAELDRVTEENARYTSSRKAAAKAPRAERHPIFAFKEDLLANSFRNV